MLLLVGVGPATDREEYFEIAIFLLEKVKLLEVAVQVVALVVPRVTVVVDLNVGPCIGEDNFAVRAVVTEGVEDVGELGGGDVLGEVFAAVDALGVSVERCMADTQTGYGISYSDCVSAPFLRG